MQVLGGVGRGGTEEERGGRLGKYSRGNNSTDRVSRRGKIEREKITPTWFALLNRRRVSTHVRADSALIRLSMPPSVSMMLNNFSKAPWKARSFWISWFFEISSSQKPRLSVNVTVKLSPRRTDTDRCASSPADHPTSRARPPVQLEA